MFWGDKFIAKVAENVASALANPSDDPVQGLESTTCHAMLGSQTLYLSIIDVSGAKKISLTAGFGRVK